MEQEDIYDGDFSDLQSGDGFEAEEGANDEYSYSDLEDDPEDPEEADDPEDQATQHSRRAGEQEAESLEVTPKFFERLKNQLLQNPGFGSLKVFLQVFFDLINEDSQKKKRKTSYLVTDFALMNSIIRFGIEAFPAILIKASGIS